MEEYIHSTILNKYVSDAYYEPHFILRGLSMIIILLIIQTGRVRRHCLEEEVPEK